MSLSTNYGSKLVSKDGIVSDRRRIFHTQCSLASLLCYDAGPTPFNYDEFVLRDYTLRIISRLVVTAVDSPSFGGCLFAVTASTEDREAAVLGLKYLYSVAVLDLDS